jgi:hypothetical protein
MLNLSSTFERKRQLKGNGYPGGVYHYNLRRTILGSDGDFNNHKRDTDIVVSKENALRIEFAQGGYDDSFELEYHFVKYILAESSSDEAIKQHFNYLIKPFTFVPKQTDQKWIIRMPYGKRVMIHTDEVDLINQNPCSKASVTFYDGNSTAIRTKCGSSLLTDRDVGSPIQSQTNEMIVSFVTQNSDDVIFLTKENLAYTGFKYFYSEIEEPGDCLFHMRNNLMCNYQPWDKLNRLSWSVVDESARFPDASKLICKRCFLRATIPSAGQIKAQPTLLSPMISVKNKYLEFSYKLGTNSRLSVRLIYENDFVSGKLETATLLMKTEESTGMSWQLGTVEIGAGLIDNYRLIFVLQKLVSFFLIQISFFFNLDILHLTSKKY